jgi:thioredoxin reductase
VVIVGGGPAGLSAAITLGRSRRSVLVIDAGSPRNARAAHVHNYLGQDGIPPAELLAAGRAEVAGYGGEVVTGTVVSIDRTVADGFEVRLAGGGTVSARRVLVATGLVDELPDVPGVAERYGRDVLHCPYCHGWEIRDRAIGVLSSGPLGAQQALVFRQWSADVTLFRHTGDGPTDEESEQLAASGIGVIDGTVAGLVVTGDRLTGVRLESGQVIARDVLTVQPRFTARTGVLAGLGLVAEQQEHAGHVIGTCVAAGTAGTTTVPGVWVAGNVGNLRSQVSTAVAEGQYAAVAINGDLIDDDVARAVAAHRQMTTSA